MVERPRSVELFTTRFENSATLRPQASWARIFDQWSASSDIKLKLYGYRAQENLVQMGVVVVCVDDETTTATAATTTTTEETAALPNRRRKQPLILLRDGEEESSRSRDHPHPPPLPPPPKKKKKKVVSSSVRYREGVNLIYPLHHVRRHPVVPLYLPEEEEAFDVDIVFVHGLGGGPFCTWEVLYVIYIHSQTP
jgi:hypothetical protein